MIIPPFAAARQKAGARARTERTAYHERMTQPVPLDLSSIADPFFRAAVAAHVAEYVRHFGERLAAVYVWGSVHRGEAVPGVSDLDLHAFIRGELSPADESWFQTERHTLDARFPETRGLNRPLPLSALLGGLRDDASPAEQRFKQSLGFRLLHDATLVWGRNLLPGPEVLPPFDRAFAAGSFEGARDLMRFAAGADAENRTDFALPDAPALRLRKLARLAVIAGGWYLVGEARLRSLHGADVLPLLRERFPAWAALLNETERLYIVPASAEQAAARLDGYTDEGARWVDRLT